MDVQEQVSSIQYLVNNSQSVDEARSKYSSMEGIFLDKFTADKVFEEALMNKFQKKSASETYESYKKKHPNTKKTRNDPLFQKAKSEPYSASPKIKTPKNWDDWEKEVEKLERGGMTRSDAQGVMDAHMMSNGYDHMTLTKKAVFEQLEQAYYELSRLKEAKLSMQEKVKTLKQKGNILNLKEPIIWKGSTYRQILTDGVRKEKGKYQLSGAYFDTPWADSMEDLTKLVDWADWEDRTNYNKKIKKGSDDFKSFDDPWKVMSPEDRKEANRLFKLAMKAFPGSPKQKLLHDQLAKILKKYGIGE